MQRERPTQIATLSQQEIIKAIQANDEGVLKFLYQANYPKIKALVLKNSGTAEQAKDIYQEAFLVLWKKVKENKFSPQNDHAIGGFLYQVARNKWTDFLRSAQRKKIVSMENQNHIPQIADEIFDLEEEQLERVMNAFAELGEGCRELLTSFYFNKKSMREISKELNMDEASVRNKKYRCMQKLKSLVFNKN